MQTVLRIDRGEPDGTHYPLGQPVGHPERNTGAKKEDTTATGKRHDFLTDKTPPLAPDFQHKNGYDDSLVSLTTPKNFDYLYQSALNYAGLTGIRLPFRYRKGDIPRLKIIELYKAMEEGVPEYINLEEEEGRLHFYLFRHHDWPEPILFWIPIDFTERLPIPLRNIVRESIRQFVRHHGVCNVTEAFCYNFAIEELEDQENRDSDAPPEGVRANKRLADSYQSGKRTKALKRMSGEPLCNSLGEAAWSYRTKKEGGQKLLELIREGMTLITPENPNLTDYLYDWACEEERGFYPVGMESQVMLVYFTHGTLAKCMEGSMNSDYQEVYALAPVTHRFLTPRMDCLFRMGDYSEKPSKWLAYSTKHIADNFQNG